LPRKFRWEDIAAELRRRILSGELKPGEKFPTNLELMKEFDAHSLTVHAAVQALIQEGLVFSHGHGGRERFVRPLPERSTRRGGFLTEFGERGRLEILRLEVVSDPGLLPPPVAERLRPPVLRYHTRQWRDRLAVALSDSYLPDRLPLEGLARMLADPKTDLYRAMESLGFAPAICEETLVARPPRPEEAELLQLPRHAAVPVVEIHRQVFDPEGNLLEVCLLVDRADCYEFVYRFSVERVTTL